jgi:hypothetical protein
MGFNHPFGGAGFRVAIHSSTVLLISQIGKFDPFLFTDYYNSYYKNAGYNMV